MRKAKPKKRVILPDPVFNDQKVSKFVNHLMYDGMKNTSYEIFYNALKTVETKLPGEETSALEVWKKALDNVHPEGLSHDHHEPKRLSVPASYVLLPECKSSLP